MAKDIDTKPAIGSASYEHQEEWAEMTPRPEWEKPEHWAAARPEGVDDV